MRPSPPPPRPPPAPLKDAAREVYRRLMDSVDPALIDTAHDTLRAVNGV